MIKIRAESEDDCDTVRTINAGAFGQDLEGKIVDKIRDSCGEFLSLVAESDGKVVGHILFSPVTIRGEKGEYHGMGLGPMAVLPESQNQGIGTALVKDGISILKKSGTPFIIVLGHPNYYPRFGFEKASKYGLAPQWEGVPDNAFMVLFLDETLKEKVQGVVYYRSEFAEAV